MKPKRIPTFSLENRTKSQLPILGAGFWVIWKLSGPQRDRWEYWGKGKTVDACLRKISARVALPYHVLCGNLE